MDVLPSAGPTPEGETGCSADCGTVVVAGLLGALDEAGESEDGEDEDSVLLSQAESATRSNVSKLAWKRRCFLAIPNDVIIKSSPKGWLKITISAEFGVFKRSGGFPYMLFFANTNGASWQLFRIDLLQTI